MNYLTFLRKYITFSNEPKISILIPFKSRNKERRRVFKWLLRYWAKELPEAEIIIGRSSSRPFSKTEALNNAAKRAHGKVLVILDADTYMPGEIIERCADKILDNKDNHLWYVPYRRLYRLSKEATDAVLSSDPSHPLRFSDPPSPDDLDGDIQKSTYGHRYGAMALIIPREAYETLGCFDERFAGWGAEDVSTLRALDTLYGKHKTINTAVYHLWHTTIGKTYHTRAWEGQRKQHPNQRLAMEYHRATGRPSRMRRLVDEGCKEKESLIDRLIEWIYLTGRND